MEQLPQWLQMLIGIPLAGGFLFLMLRWYFQERLGGKYRKKRRK
ncbi:hypothetical protein [Adhaeribacter aquaticus]|nr:hypothetical protein [Adhaeribacter aquaticus]